jgi:threonine dehydrogenase-like Zn-dependent dehydrogenase
MKNQNIIFTSVGVAEMTETEAPIPAAGEVLVRSVRDTISTGTERANLMGDPNVSIYSNNKVAIYPRSAGYSIAGVVEAVGADVKSVKVGDRVACSWTKHSKYNALIERKVYKLPDEVGFDAAALVHIATFPLAAIRKCKVELGESAMVMGLGVLGLAAVQLLHAAGAVPVIACDPIESKRQRALELGADFALDPFDPEFSKKLKELTNGGANVCIEVTGLGQGLDMALDCMAKFGRVALLGCTRNSDFTIDYYHKVHGPGITLVGAHTAARPTVDSSDGWWTERADAFTLINLQARGRINLAALVEEVHSYTEGPEVFGRLATEKNFPIVQFDWEK